MHTIYFNNSKALFWSLYHHLGPLLILFRIHMKISSERNPNTSWAVFCQSCTKVSNCKSGAFLLFLAIPRSTTKKHTWLQSLCSRTTCGRQKNKKLQSIVFFHRRSWLAYPSDYPVKPLPVCSFQQNTAFGVWLLENNLSFAYIYIYLYIFLFHWKRNFISWEAKFKLPSSLIFLSRIAQLF